MHGQEVDRWCRSAAAAGERGRPVPTDERVPVEVTAGEGVGLQDDRGCRSVAADFDRERVAEVGRLPGRRPSAGSLKAAGAEGDEVGEHAARPPGRRPRGGSGGDGVPRRPRRSRAEGTAPRRRAPARRPAPAAAARPRRPARGPGRRPRSGTRPGTRRSTACGGVTRRVQDEPLETAGRAAPLPRTLELDRLALDVDLEGGGGRRTAETGPPGRPGPVAGQRLALHAHASPAPASPRRRPRTRRPATAGRASTAGRGPAPAASGPVSRPAAAAPAGVQVVIDGTGELISLRAVSMVLSSRHRLLPAKRRRGGGRLQVEREVQRGQDLADLAGCWPGRRARIRASSRSRHDGRTSVAGPRSRGRPGRPRAAGLRCPRVGLVVVERDPGAGRRAAGIRSSHSSSSSPA